MIMKIKEKSVALSKKTIDILRNFSNINRSIIFSPGNKISTISVADNVFAEATVEESFPQEFAIYELHELLQGLSLMPDNTIVFDNESYLKIKSGRSTIKYYFSDASLIKRAPEKIDFPETDVEFSLTEKEILSLTRSASVYELPDFSVIGDGNQIKVVVGNKDNETAHTVSIVVGKTDKEFSYNMKVENIKIMDGDYKISISSKLISKFENLNSNVIYYIALERP